MRKAVCSTLTSLPHRGFSQTSSVPLFLCPALLRARPQSSKGFSRRSLQPKSWQRRLQTEATAQTTGIATEKKEPYALPFICPGCGALSEGAAPGEAGFYSPGRKTVRLWLRQGEPKTDPKKVNEDAIFSEALQKADKSLLNETGLQDASALEDSERPPLQSPVCDRCHHLLHHHTGTSIIHPSLDSLRDTIAESPYKYNHIYHVLDAADFPLSLVSGIHRKLTVTPQRSQNRRSKSGGRFYHGKKAELSFIITRSDLLAPKKDQVDHLMPYLVQVLRDELGSEAKDVRLGNVRCVSSKRGWWTKEVKEQIWSRGGGGWMVGKVNVGKSNLFEAVFPKGRSENISYDKLRREASLQQSEETLDAIAEREATENNLYEAEENTSSPEADVDPEALDDTSLLPPPQREVNYPTMPIISSLPGTTASPIRLAFGGGRGELIDLPGLARGNLEAYVKEEHQQDLVMRSRVTPVQQVLKPGQSLLVAGLIRITPRTENLVFLAYSFLPFSTHVTSTAKATELQLQQRESGVKNMAKDGVDLDVASAGTFQLGWDVTKQRSGPLTRPSAAGLKADRLPYRILSTDILIEGAGWIELVAQVRKKDLEATSDIGDPQDPFDPVERPPDGKIISENLPMVEVFSPKGKHVGTRRPMNAWLLGSLKSQPSSPMKKRPRRSVKGEKKAMKHSRRTE
ncbi:MAG: hypothetical protein M4579_005837 [Chaenotheca gracillima]|nr:MAG: hypothetical protein M4579_005837 [Chaenotheca gracillima]